MSIKEKIEQAKKDIFSSDWKVQVAVSDFLAKNDSNETRQFLISLLSSGELQVRNAAALAISEIKDKDAVDPLIAAIFKKENRHNNGTLVYALQTLDCSQKIKELFSILFKHDYEPQIMAGHILKEQQFIYTKEDIVKIVEDWNKVKENKHDKERTFIQAIVDKFTQL